METDSNNLQEPLLLNEVAMEGADWRTALQQEERERIANEMMETLKRNIPLIRQEDLPSFKKIAVRFEETIYSEATSQSDYLRRVSLKMTKMKANSMNRMANSLQSNAASNSEGAQDPASQSMQSQIQDQVQQLSTVMVSNQSQVQSQNIQDNIASTGVPNSAGSAPAQPPVDGKSKGIVPAVPVQKLNAQSMSNEAPFSVRHQMNLLLPNQQTLQHDLLGLQLQANTLPGDTQQRIRLTARMFQPQTSTHQQKQSSQSQGNMPDFKLASQSVQSQIQNQVQQLPTAMVSDDQSQVQSQNIPYSIASTGVPNSAGSAPAGPPVNGKSQSTMPSVPVQNLNAQNMSNETPFAVRDPMMQGRSTNSMFKFGQQQVMPQSITQSHIQQQKLMQQELLGLHRLANTLPNAIVSDQSQEQQQQRMNLLQLLNQPTIQQLMQQHQLGLQQEANTLPGDTQQRIQSTAPVLHPQTTIEQKKQLSQSQGNMPGFKLTSQSVQSQIQDQFQKFSTAMVSDQSEVQSRNIQDIIASTEVPNSADTPPAMLLVDDKSQGTMPSVPVQNLNTQNMSNETPFAVRRPMMQQFITQQQQKTLQLVNTLPKAMVLNQSQMQQQQKMNLLEPNQPTLQQLMQQTQLRLQQRANTLPGATQQRIQSTAPTLQQQTTIDQKKQLSQSQGNMPDFKLGINLDSGKKAVSAITKRHRSPVSSLQRGQLTQNMLAVQQSQQQQPQIPPNEGQMNSQMQPINIQGPAMPTQPNNLTGLQQNILSSGSDVSNSSQNMLGGGLHPGSNVDHGQGNVLNQTQEVARNSMQQNPVGGSQQMNSSVSSQNGLSALQSNSNVVQPQQGNALNQTQEVSRNSMQQNPAGGSQQMNSSVSSQNGLSALQSNSNVVQPQQGNALNQTQEVSRTSMQQNPVGGSQQMNSSVSTQNGLSALQSNSSVIQPQQGNALNETQEVAVNPLQQNPVGGSVTTLQSNSNVVPPQKIQMLSTQLFHQHQQQQQMLEQYMVRLSMQQEQFQQLLFQQHQWMQQQLYPQHQQWLQTSQKQSVQQSIQQQQERTSQKQSAQQPIQQQQEQTSQKQSAQQPIQQLQEQTSQNQSGQQMTPETPPDVASSVLLVLVFVQVMLLYFGLKLIS